MATTYFKGTAPAVQQVSKVTFGTYDVATTRTITIGGVSISAADSGGTLTAALTALAALLNSASAHIYFRQITWTSTATEIIGTADNAGAPFVFSGSVAGGTGTVSGGGVMTTTIANAGPNDFSTAANWSGGAFPSAGDIAVIKDCSVNILWGLSQAATQLLELRVEKTFTGKLGLNRRVFVTSADESTTDSTALEYRDLYLAIGADSGKLMQHFGPGAPAGSGRIMWDVGNNASTIEIFSSAQASTELGRPAIRIKANDPATIIYVRSCPAGLGLATEVPGETSEVSTVSVTDPTTATKVLIGPGVTINTFTQNGGNNVLQAAATIAVLNVLGGNLQTEGDYTITTANLYAGEVTANHFKSAGNAFTTLNMEGGIIDASDSARPRIWATVNLNKGTIEANGSVLTITTLNDRSGKYKLVATQ